MIDDANLEVDFFSRRALRPFLGGRKPSKRNRSVGRPEDTNAAKDAEAPGIASIVISCTNASLISLYAGSEIPGVPASVITAKSFPLFK